MKLVTIATFATPSEAHIAVNLLESHGIRGVLVDEHTTNMLWHMSPAVGGTKLQVDEGDSAQAAAILCQAAEKASAIDAVAGAGSGWSCPKCGEALEPEFEICWKCGTAMDGTEDPTFAGADETAPETEHEAIEAPSATEARESQQHTQGAPSVPLCETGNPYQSPALIVGADVDVTESFDPALDEMATRAWRASLLGVACVPIFSLYSAWLVLRVAFSGGNLSPQGFRRCCCALILDVLLMLLFTAGALNLGLHLALR